MSGVRPPSSQLVTVFGGSGFLGRNVVRVLAKRGYRLRVAVRRPELARFPTGRVGQIQAVQANLRYPRSVAHAVANTDAVVNLVGVLGERGRQSFAAVHAEGARIIAESAPPGARIVQVSALGADAQSASAYARSKAAGEHAVLTARADAVVLRPSVMFGPGDSFFNRFATLARAMPVIPLVGGATRFQPIYVGDVAEAIARAVDETVAKGRIYELGGPEIRTLRALVDYVLATTGRQRLVVDLPFSAGRVQAAVMEFLDAVSFGLLPAELRLTRDQVLLLRRDNVVSEAAISEQRDLAAIGIEPTALEAIVPAYLTRFRKTGQFDIERVT